MRKETFKELLTPAEQAIFKKIDSPGKIQDFLDSLPIAA